MLAKKVAFLVCGIVLTGINISASAHNKIVVVPFGSDEQPPLRPTVAVAKVNPSQVDYTIMSNTVVDNITQLEWQRFDDNESRIWIESHIFCWDLELNGKTDWRLPTAAELLSIVDYGSSNPAIDEAAFPGVDMHPLFSSAFWSASAGGGSVSSSALAVNFLNGSADVLPFVTGSGIFSGTIRLFTRCVR